MRALTLAGVVLARLALGDVPAPPRASCAADADCAISTYAGCCPGCCPREPYAAPATAPRRCTSKMECPEKRCSGDCPAVTNASDWVAQCREGLCVRAPATGGCTADADCVITEFSGCCGGCCQWAHAMAKRELEAQQRRCAAVDCAPRDCRSERCRAPVPASSLRASCQAGACVAVARGPLPPAECGGDADCTVRYPGPGPGAACHRSPCGCCPGTEPVAVPVGKSVPLNRPPPGTPSEPAPPPFGLSDGKGTTAPPRPTCSPCPAPRPARATCAAGRCVLAPDGPHILE